MTLTEHEGRGTGSHIALYGFSADGADGPHSFVTSGYVVPPGPAMGARGTRSLGVPGSGGSLKRRWVRQTLTLDQCAHRIAGRSDEPGPARWPLRPCPG